MPTPGDLESSELVYSCLKCLPGGRERWQEASSVHTCLNHHGKYWWNTCGYILAVLLQCSGYSYLTQTKALYLFTQVVAPNLGNAREPGARLWESFMTDDHTPIELSWDWHEGDQKPTIRFSMEAVGAAAGSPDDPFNFKTFESFKVNIFKGLSETDLLWFHHLDKLLGRTPAQISEEGHRSRIFWAFDLDDAAITTKAYFLPIWQATATGRNSLQVITEAIASGPQNTLERLRGYDLFVQFHDSYCEPQLKIEMLGIDLVSPEKSRFKIYFRNRDTSFRSVVGTMTLGGRIKGVSMDKSLQKLKKLFSALFEQNFGLDCGNLPLNNHRTAGILYNVEFNLRGQPPAIKIYIPVRHYASNDAQVLRAVSEFVASQTPARGGKGTLNTSELSPYAGAMFEIL